MTNLSSGCTQYSQVSFEATLSSKQQNHAILTERHLYISFWYTRGAGSWSKCRLDSFECKFKKEWTICMRAKLPQSCPTLCDPMDCNPPVSSDHGILQARILEWVVMPSSKGSSWPRDWTHISHVSCIGRQGGAYTCNRILAIKKSEIVPFAAAWMDLESVILSEVIQTEKEKYMTSFICRT